jgi:hypothetical protein
MAERVPLFYASRFADAKSPVSHDDEFNCTFLMINSGCVENERFQGRF